MSQNEAFGTHQSNGIWFNYRATQTINDEKVPFGKLVRGLKNDDGSYTDIPYDYIAGNLVAVQLRENKGNPEKGVDPYTEIVLTLEAEVDGAPTLLKLPLRSSSTAGYGIARRLHNFEKGDPTHISAFVSKEFGANITIRKGTPRNNETVEAIETGIEFEKTDGVSGAKVALLRNRNAVAREEWVTDAVKALSFYTEESPATPEAEAYDPFGPGEAD